MANWTVIGAGDVVQRQVAPGLLAAGERIAAIWAPRPEQRNAVAARFGAAAPNALCDAIELGQAVYICTPVNCHTDVAVAALERGRHVLTEKPLAMGLGPTERLKSLLSANNRIAFRVAYYRRFWPLITQLRRLIVSEVLGPLHRAEISFAQPYLPLTTRPNWRLDPQRAGGGIIADAGSHRLDYLVALLGWPDTAAVGAAHLHGEAVEAEAEVHLTWPGGARAAVQMSWLDDAKDEIRLIFADGSAAWTATAPATISIIAPTGPQALLIDHPAEPLQPMIRQFVGAMRRSEEDTNPLERNVFVADAWRFDALLARLTRQARAEALLAISA